MGSEKGYPGTPLMEFHPSNPTLVPNFDSPVVGNDHGVGVPTVAMASPEAIVEANPETSAVGHVKVSGTITANDVIGLVFTNANLPDSPVTISLTITTETTPAQVATALQTSITASTTLASWGITAAVDGVDTAKINVTQSSPIGNLTVMSYTQGSNTEVLTFTTGGSLVGAGGVIIPYNNFDFAYNGQTFAFWIGKPVIVDQQLMEALIAAKAPIK